MVRYYKYLLPGVLILIVLLIAFIAYMLFPKKHSNTMSKGNATISGQIDFNGVPPENGTIALYAAPKDSNSFELIQNGIQAQDVVKWEWQGATDGKMYDIKASLIDGSGKQIAQSNVITVAAPATGEMLVINSPHTPATTTAASLSGSVGLNGYIPTNATINVVARQSGTLQFNQIVSNLNATDMVTWSWSGATAGESYDIQARLLSSNGTVISESSISTVSAPAANEVLNITSQLKPPSSVQSGSASISGFVDLNGSIPNSTTVQIAYRVTGTTQFNMAINGMNATNGAAWSIPNLNAGTSYDIQAYLQQGGQTVIYSQIYTFTAPAANEIITINAPSQAAAPPQMTSFQCFNQNSSGLWNVTASFQVQSGAQQYWVQIGTSPQSLSNVFQLRYQPSSSTLSGNIYTLNTGNLFTTGTTYYANYAYSQSATSGFSGDFSLFSNVASFTCNAQPTSTNTPTPTLTNTPTPTPTNTPTPTPTTPPPTNGM